MTETLRRAMVRAMEALRAVDAILDGGDPGEIGDIDDDDAEAMVRLSDLAGDVSVHAEVVSDGAPYNPAADGCELCGTPTENGDSLCGPCYDEDE